MRPRSGPSLIALAGACVRLRVRSRSRHCRGSGRGRRASGRGRAVPRSRGRRRPRGDRAVRVGGRVRRGHPPRSSDRRHRRADRDARRRGPQQHRCRRARACGSRPPIGESCTGSPRPPIAWWRRSTSAALISAVAAGGGQVWVTRVAQAPGTSCASIPGPIRSPALRSRSDRVRTNSCTHTGAVWVANTSPPSVMRIDPRTGRVATVPEMGVLGAGFGSYGPRRVTT